MEPQQNGPHRRRYPFFLHSIFARLVPPLSTFFTAILDHYEIQALHLQPNSILLQSVFAFDHEAFIGVRPSVALFRHFFSLCLHDGAHLSACVSFVASQSGSFILKVGKKFGDDDLRLQAEDLPTEELNKVVATLLGGNPGDLPEALVPLYRLDNRDDLITTLPVFAEQGLLPAEGSGPVEVSSEDTSDGEDSEKTVDDCPTSAPLRELEDDDVAGEVHRSGMADSLFA
ncbi:hypothetical protein D1007_44281 [Hordeum vulgare]|nr:hypothetical protein D1007_44281 [Hordeum vulgare]